jgi:hypothetical protein
MVGLKDYNNFMEEEKTINNTSWGDVESKQLEEWENEMGDKN